MWPDRYASTVGRSDQLASGIGHGGAASFTHQSSIPTGQDRRDHDWDVARRSVLIEFTDLDLLNWPNQRQSLQEGSGAAGIFRNEIIEACRQLNQRGAEFCDGIARC
jgi:hypothetical protein